MCKTSLLASLRTFPSRFLNAKSLVEQQRSRQNTHIQPYGRKLFYIWLDDLPKNYDSFFKSPTISNLGSIVEVPCLFDNNNFIDSMVEVINEKANFKRKILKKKKYTNPSMCITDALYYLEIGNEVLCSEMVWAAYSSSIAFLFQKFGIRIRTHTCLNYLAFYAINFHPDKQKREHLETLVDFIQCAHENFYCGSDSTEAVKKYIGRVGKFVEYFSEINKDDVWKELGPNLPQGRGDGKVYANVMLKKLPIRKGIFGSGPYTFTYQAFTLKYRDRFIDF
ncbi:hypothetical protein ACQ4LE_008096 [Meloidogyne hapla]